MRDHCLQATLFGNFKLADEGEDVRPRSQKSAALLAYLIASDCKGASRMRLASLFWSDRGEAQARVSLRQTIAELRSGPPAIARAQCLTSGDLSDIGPLAISMPRRSEQSAHALASIAEEVHGASSTISTISTICLQPLTNGCRSSGYSNASVCSARSSTRYRTSAKGQRTHGRLRKHEWFEKEGSRVVQFSRIGGSDGAAHVSPKCRSD